MEKMVLLRSICRAACCRSWRIAGAISHHHLRRHVASSRSIFTLSSSNRITSDLRCGYAAGIESRRYFKTDNVVTHLETIQDPDVKRAFKDLLAASWDTLPDPLIYDVMNALSKQTDDKAGQEILKNVLRAAEAVEEFGGTIITLKMELDDMIGMSGENVDKPVPKDLADALRTAYKRYSDYLESFGPDEDYLRKKVENELGSKMIYLKMRCRLGPEWGKVTVIGTSGLAGSYVEQRAD